MFLVDVSPSMGKMREVEVPATEESGPTTVEMTNLEWSLQFVMLKIQEMVQALVIVTAATFSVLTERNRSLMGERPNNAE